MAFAALAFATARTALGTPNNEASPPYDTVCPYGISNSPFHTLTWNSVPAKDRGISNVFLSFLKYSSNCRAASLVTSENASSKEQPKNACKRPDTLPGCFSSTQLHRQSRSPKEPSSKSPQGEL